MMKESEKFSDSALLEGMTSLRAALRGIDRGVNNRRILRVIYAAERKKKLIRELAFLESVRDKYGIDMIESTLSEIEERTLGSSHGGIIAECSDRTFPLLAESMHDISRNGFYVMPEGIEDPYNFGYALRSLYAAGVDGVILGHRNWMSAAGVVARASAGASELFPVFIAEPEEAAELFHTLDYRIVCADIRTEHLLEETEIPYPVLLVVGGERRGISRAVLDLADLKVRISYGREFHASLSAASAATILSYEIFRQNRNRSK
jgi:23S rRNA (guanosine2251-2'-O)-methyltransferase